MTGEDQHEQQSTRHLTRHLVIIHSLPKPSNSLLLYPDVELSVGEVFGLLVTPTKLLDGVDISFVLVASHSFDTYNINFDVKSWIILPLKPRQGKKKASTVEADGI